MKNYILSFFFLFILHQANSQQKFGALVGLNASAISDGYLVKMNDFGVAYHLGVSYQFDINDNLSFRPKLVFSQQGDRNKTKNITNITRFNNYTNNNLDYKLSYLNIPLNFKYFNKTYILLGPQLGFLLSTKKMLLDFGNIEKSIEIGINTGIGHQLNNFFIEFNAYQGFTTILKHEGSRGFDATNFVLQLSFGYNL